jgi:hypothetical protein
MAVCEPSEVNVHVVALHLNSVTDENRSQNRADFTVSTNS